MSHSYSFTKIGQTIPLKEIYNLIATEYPKAHDQNSIQQIFQHTCIKGRKMKDLAEETREQNPQLSKFLTELITIGYEMGNSYYMSNA